VTTANSQYDQELQPRKIRKLFVCPHAIGKAHMKLDSLQDTFARCKKLHLDFVYVKSQPTGVVSPNAIYATRYQKVCNRRDGTATSQQAHECIGQAHRSDLKAHSSRRRIVNRAHNPQSQQTHKSTLCPQRERICGSVNRHAVLNAMPKNPMQRSASCLGNLQSRHGW